MKIRSKSVLCFLVAVLVFLASSIILAQPMKPWKGWRGSGGWGMNSQYQRIYNPATVETVSGTVESVNKITPMKGMYYGIELFLKTEKGVIPVHLGPGWYIERLDTKIENGDKIEVKGSRVEIMGKLAIIAADVKKGNSVVILRDSSGIPVWAGWRR